MQNNKSLKFIITSRGELITGSVEYHRELLPPDDKTKPLGGGRWAVATEGSNGNWLIFYGKSEQYGAVERWQFERATITQRQIGMANRFFSQYEYYSDALADFKAFIRQQS